MLLIKKKFVYYGLILLAMVGLFMVCACAGKDGNSMNNENEFKEDNEVCESYSIWDDPEVDKEAYLAYINYSDNNGKRYWVGSIRECFMDDRVYVTLKHKYSKINAEVRLEDFGIDHKRVGLGAITDRSRVDDPKTALIDHANFIQMLSIELKNKGKANVIEAIRELEKSEIVLSAYPAATGAIPVHDGSWVIPSP